MENKKIKYCILTNVSLNNFNRKNIDLVGFYQWLNIFEGEVLQADDALHQLKDGEFDIIHINLNNKNLDIPKILRKKIGKNSKTKIIVSMDIPVEFWNFYSIDRARINTAISNADFIFGTEYKITLELEKLSGKTVYEISHPADINKIKNNNIKKKDFITILGSIKSNNELKIIKKISKATNSKIRIMRHYKTNVNYEFINNESINEIVYKDNDELYDSINESKYIISFYEYSNYGKFIIYAAAQGCIVIGNNCVDSIRRCYPYTSAQNIDDKDVFSIYMWLKNDQKVNEFIKKNAYSKVEYYNWGNQRKRFLDLLFLETKDNRFIYQKYKFDKNNNLIIFINEINHLYGKQQIQYKKNEFVVVCLDSFLKHYRILGSKHFFFIDNGSEDGTIELLKRYEDVTIYETKLAHKEYEEEIRKTIIEEHCRYKWCLCVDIDEFFDYPFSDRISMENFLGYMNKNHFTAVIAYMLDMFPKKLSFKEDDKDLNLVEKYCFYDISDIKKEDYSYGREAFCNYNILSNKNMKNYFGGIRKKKFRTKKNMLIKHPLMFIDNKLDPVVNPHFCNKAIIADVNGIIRHYKFIPSFKRKVIESVKSNIYMFFAGNEYNSYYKVIKNKNSYNLYSIKSRVYNINDLISNKFILISKQFLDYITNS